MNDTAKSLMNSKASSSGTHSRVATNTANTASIDEEFSAFFDQGDAGDYVGGLSESPLSVDPVTYDEPKEEHAVVKPAGRRAFFAKVVTVVVAGCATLMMVAVGLKSLPSQAHARPSAGMVEVAQNRESLSREALAMATPKKEVGAVAAASPSELPPAAQQERTISEPVVADAPQVAAMPAVSELTIAEPIVSDAPRVAAMPAVPEPTIAEPVTAQSHQVAAVPRAKSASSSEAVPAKSSNPSPKTVKPMRDIQPLKTSLARVATKSRHSSQAPTTWSATGVRQASTAGSKPSVVAFPVD